VAGILFALGEPTVDPAMEGLGRTWLDETSWVDHLPRWLSGSDTVFAELVARLAWQQPSVVMYDRVVETPRLVWWWHEDRDPPSALPAPRAGGRPPVPHAALRAGASRHRLQLLPHGD